MTIRIKALLQNRLMEYRKWSGKLDKEIVEHAISNGFWGLGPTEAFRIDGSFYRIVNQRGLSDEIFRRENNKWRDKRKNGMKRYAQETGIFKADTKTAKEKDRCFYQAAYKAGMVDDFFVRNTRKPRRWSAMSDTQIVRYVKERGLYKKSPKAVELKDSGLYITINQRRLGDRIFSRIRAPAEISD